jgi:NTE family protein
MSVMAVMAMGDQGIGFKKGKITTLAGDEGKVVMTAHPKSAHFKPLQTRQKAINLALQGGGSHGAVTWGVLDRLLEEDQIEIDGITATSAGSINAVLMAYGLSIGGNEYAKKELRLFWRRASAVASRVFQPSILDKISGNFGLDYSASYIAANLLSQFMSPYQLNPFNLNPLKDLLESMVDFKLLREQPAVKLFLSATNVQTGKLKVFYGRELTADHVLASSCLPFLMHAVEIDGERYWDGGFVGNPALFPVIYECDTRDIVLVHLTPTTRPGFPVTASSILMRMQEVSLNSSLMRELRAVEFVNKLIDRGKTSYGKEILVHVVEAEDAISKLPSSSKLNGDWDFLLYLHDLGRRRADEWLASNVGCLGVKSSIDWSAKYL